MNTIVSTAARVNNPIVATIAPIAIEPPRGPDGKITRSTCPWAITPVMLTARGGLVAYRVGATGPIFAERAAARRFALAREGRAIDRHYDAMCPASL